jgi:predicted ATPase with chaperone activity
MWFPEKSFDLTKTRLAPSFVRELLLKTLHQRGQARGLDLARDLCVPFPLIEGELTRLKQNQLCGIISGTGVGGYENMDFALTSAGRQQAAEAAARTPYIGPAPVDLAEYIESVERQRLHRVEVDEARLSSSLRRRMVVSDALVSRLGPAVAAGGPLFLYGNSGNGKTLLAEQIAALLRQGIFVPHALEVDGQVIRIYDERVHHRVEPADVRNHDPYEAVRTRVDSRWVYVYRPFVVVGGELDLAMLDLTYQETARCYEAPLQVRANCGLLLIDDFGRQLVSPRALLNRWIYPLEKRVDYLTLVTGKKICVPFHQFLIFSTNLDPRELADEAFWRRINYKIEVPDPDPGEFEAIFRACCDESGLAFDALAYEGLLQRCYHGPGRGLRACHPRDLVRQMSDLAAYRGLERRMSEELVEGASATYFVDL